MTHPMVFVTTFLAACVEVIEPVIIVVGLAAFAGDARRGLVAGAGLAVLAVLVLGLGRR